MQLCGRLYGYIIKREFIQVCPTGEFHMLRVDEGWMVLPLNQMAYFKTVQSSDGSDSNLRQHLLRGTLIDGASWPL